MIDLHRLSIVLKHANSLPPMHSAEAKQDFYKLKEAILRTYGTKEPQEDIQHIRKECWACTEGIYRGRYDWDEQDGEMCFKCNGTGIYSERWIRLERWRLGNQIFHRPIGETICRNATIKGIIQHRRVKLALAAQRVLTFVCQPQYWVLLEQFRMCDKDVRRFKMILAYLLGFPRDRWKTTTLQWGDVKGECLPLREAVLF